MYVQCKNCFFFNKMGYGSRAIELLTEYFEGRIMCIAENANDSVETGESMVENEVNIGKYLWIMLISKKYVTIDY